MLKSNKPIDFVHLQKLGDQSILNDAKISTVLSDKSKKIFDC